MCESTEFSPSKNRPKDLLDSTLLYRVCPKNVSSRQFIYQSGLLAMITAQDSESITPFQAIAITFPLFHSITASRELGGNQWEISTRDLILQTTNIGKSSVIGKMLIGGNVTRIDRTLALKEFYYAVHMAFASKDDMLLPWVKEDERYWGGVESGLLYRRALFYMIAQYYFKDDENVDLLSASLLDFKEEWPYVEYKKGEKQSKMIKTVYTSLLLLLVYEIESIFQTRAIGLVMKESQIHLPENTISDFMRELPRYKEDARKLSKRLYSVLIANHAPLLEDVVTESRRSALDSSSAVLQYNSEQAEEFIRSVFYEMNIFYIRGIEDSITKALTGELTERKIQAYDTNMRTAIDLIAKRKIKIENVKTRTYASLAAGDFDPWNEKEIKMEQVEKTKWFAESFPGNLATKEKHDTFNVVLKNLFPANTLVVYSPARVDSGGFAETADQIRRAIAGKTVDFLFVIANDTGLARTILNVYLLHKQPKSTQWKMLPVNVIARGPGIGTVFNIPAFQRVFIDQVAILSGTEIDRSFENTISDWFKAENVDEKDVLVYLIWFLDAFSKGFTSPAFISNVAINLQLSNYIENAFYQTVILPAQQE